MEPEGAGFRSITTQSKTSQRSQPLIGAVHQPPVLGCVLAKLPPEKGENTHWVEGCRHWTSNTTSKASQILALAETNDFPRCRAVGANTHSSQNPTAAVSNGCRNSQQSTVLRKNIQTASVCRNYPPHSYAVAREKYTLKRVKIRSQRKQYWSTASRKKPQLIELV